MTIASPYREWAFQLIEEKYLASASYQRAALSSGSTPSREAAPLKAMCVAESSERHDMQWRECDGLGTRVRRGGDICMREMMIMCIHRYTQQIALRQSIIYIIYHRCDATWHRPADIKAHCKRKEKLLLGHFEGRRAALGSIYSK